MGVTDSRPEPEELRELCRSFLDDRDPVALLGAGDDAQQTLWAQLTEMGWAATLIGDDLGGMGWTWREAAVLAEELGRTLAPVPFLSTALVTVSGLRTIEHPEATASLTGIAAGETRVAVAGLPSQSLASEGVTVTGRVTCSVTGTASFVLDAAGADQLVVIGRRRDEYALVLVDPVSSVQLERHELFDQSRSAAALRFSETPGTVLAEGKDAERAVAAMEDALALGLACDALGGATHVHGEAVEYARNRVQFGRPIGSFQAIKHRLADLFVLLQGTAAVVDAAAGQRSDIEEPNGPITSLAHAYAAEAYARIVGDAILVHGAIGFTWEHRLHRYLKRAVLNQHLAGSVSSHRRRHLDAKLATIGGSK